MLSFSKVHELSLSRDYCARWGMVEAVREILQNALDSESPFEYSFGHDHLIVSSKFAKLTPQTLLLGKTSKADNRETIGSFGEGYKIALLVLTRLGYPVVIHNGDRDWTPEFRQSRSFDAETLHIVDTAAAFGAQAGVSFEINGLSGGDIDAIRESCLHMQDDIGETIETPYGRILRARKGKLYVGGLFVCETEMHFGYDIKPEHIQLERDRQTVSGFDLAMRAVDMWFSSKRHDEIASMIAAEVPDMEYAHWGTPEIVKEACFKLFQKSNPGAVVATSKADLEEKVKRGMTSVVYIGSSMGNIVASSPSYLSQEHVAIPTPMAHLERFFSRNRQYMRTPAIVEFKELMRKAATWKP